jgi:hypothetical protein
MENLQCNVEGKLTAIKPFNTKEGQSFEHHITVPAVDEYSHPNVISVVAGRKLGALNDLLSLVVRVAGYRKSFVTREGDSVIKIEHRLFAV